jgi:hypothetical protein
MALKNIVEIEGELVIKTDYGLIVKGKDVSANVFYIKVDNIQATKKQANASVSFNSDKLNFKKNYSFKVSVENNAPNFIKQAYEYLKTLPEFANAEDC